MTEKLPEWLCVLILLIVFFAIFIVIVAIDIPGAVANKLKSLVKVIWGTIP